MALLTGVLGRGPSDVLCSAAQDAFPLSGMVPMYVLMSAFHSAPWLKLISANETVPVGPDPAIARRDQPRTLLRPRVPSDALRYQ